MLYPRYKSVGSEWYSFPEYSLHGNFGGSIGAAFNHQLNRYLSVSLGLDYQILNLQEAMSLRNPSCPTGLETFRERDFGGYIFTLGISWEF